LQSWLHGLSTDPEIMRITRDDQHLERARAKDPGYLLIGLIPHAAGSQSTSPNDPAKPDRMQVWCPWCESTNRFVRNYLPHKA